MDASKARPATARRTAVAVPSTVAWFNDVVALTETNARGGMALLVRHIGRLLHEDRTDDIDLLFRTVAAGDLGAQVLIGLLRYTVLADDRLPSRRPFLAETRRVLKARGRNVTRLLVGLERKRTAHATPKARQSRQYSKT